MSNPNAQIAAIPQFSLYGERVRTLDPEFVHIEEISARSSEHNWVIKPHRHTHLFQVLHIYDGAVQMKLDDATYELEGAWAITIPAGVVHGFHFKPHTKGMVLSVASHLLSSGFKDKSQGVIEEMASLALAIDLRSADWRKRQLQSYLRLMYAELGDPDIDQHTILYSLLKVILLTLRRQFRQSQNIEENHGNVIQLSNRFRGLLETRYREHWKIQEYAQALNVSVSTLNRVCHQAFMCNAKAMIQDRLMIEAKRNLIYTVETLERIAYDLGFKDPAYFSRFFKSIEGVSPKSYRENLKTQSRE